MKNLIYGALRKGLNLGLDALLPPVCPATGEFVDRHGMVSPAYWQNLRFISAPYCRCCGLPFDYDRGNTGGSAFADSPLTDRPENPDTSQQPAPQTSAEPAGTLCVHCLYRAPDYDMHRAALVYDDISRQIILRFKHGDQAHAARAFVPWLVSAGRDLFGGVEGVSSAHHPSSAPHDFIVPVPLHFTRLIKRRYNQAALIGRFLSEAVKIPAQNNMLKRIKATAPQGHKNAAARHDNVKNAFVVPEKMRPLLQGKSILLVDDVYTTGATVNACAKALRKAGAARVDVLSIARTVRS